MKKSQLPEKLKSKLLLLISFLSFSALGFGQSSGNTFTDPRDNQTYRTITISKEVGLGVSATHTWLAENLNYNMEGAYCCYDDPQNCTQYGRLYTWEAAQNACPPGWRLPTDLDWQRLMHQFSEGGLHSGERGREAAYSALIDKGSSGFNALLGGYRYSDGEYVTLGRYGYYWSATGSGAGSAWYYLFYGNDRWVNRLYNSRLLGFSCRCLKDDN